MSESKEKARSLFDELGDKLGESNDVSAGQMFGKPCLKIGKKAFASFFQNEMVFKLGAQEIEEISGKFTGSVLWDPSEKKRPMKDWLQVPFEFHDSWFELAERAQKFVELD